MTFRVKGFFLFAFALMVFNIGLTLHQVDKEAIFVASCILSVLVGPYVISGRIFEDGEKTDE